MTILLAQNDAKREWNEAEPAFFVDLNLDQVIEAITRGKEDYDLTPFFYSPLKDSADVAYRQAIMRDVEKDDLRDKLNAFADEMHIVRKDLKLVEKLHNDRQKQRWFLNAINTYCAAARQLAADLEEAKPLSAGLSEFSTYLTGYVGSENFTALYKRAEALIENLSAIRYVIEINGGQVEARHCDNQSDYGAEVKATFERFNQGDVHEHVFKFGGSADLNSVEASILHLVTQLHPDIFAELESFAAQEQGFIEDKVATFDREIQFYISYVDYLARLRDAGLQFCYPKVDQKTKNIFNDEGFDLALATKLVSEGKVPVCNDFYLKGQERIIVVSGPNQGGKTTFARTFGQLHYLACLGCPVPGKRAKLFLFDNLFSHFEREENSDNLRSKLQDDLLRVHEILQHATPQSLIVMNEIFSSTTLSDATLLSQKVADHIIELDLLCVWVTFISELASLGPQTVSMESTIVPDDPAKRTLKVIRKPADGLAYALSIAEKYGLTNEMILQRLSQ